jgi:L-alanine-DL-glutamate epimerase-like enolase superfamily enzyme
LTAALKEIFLPMLNGLDLGNIAEFTERARKIPENTFAKTLVESALWDLRAAHGDGGFWASWESPGEVPMSWLLTRQAPELMAQETTGMISRYGFATLKLKGGQGVATDVLAARAVRAAAGPDVRIFVDANRSYDAADAPAYLSALGDEGICAVEDPYPLAPDAQFERIQGASPIPIVVDSNGASLRNVKMFCERGARTFALKPSFIGFSEALRIADYAAQQDCAVHVGVGGESDVGSLATLGAAAKLTSPATWLPAETSFFLLLRDRLLFEPLEITAGKLRLPNAKTLAELIDWERVEHFHP